MPHSHTQPHRGTNVRHVQSDESIIQNMTPSQRPVPIDANANTLFKEEFDEYGAELAPGARIWKTYVKEADKFDMERVDGWNRSLDVTIIFATLFTAICTAFVIESSKSLKKDPTEMAAGRLNQVTSILLVVAGVSDSSQINSTEILATMTSNPPPPRPLDLCVNLLWFFSLILSATTALIAILAKEWCYLFMSGRIGDPWSQTNKRQQHWEGIERWKMEQVIMFLPSLIHLAFWTFAVGLCIYLGDLNIGVAIPVTFVTLGSMLIYTASTFLPLFNLFNMLCPYSTSISRLIQRFNKYSRRSKYDYKPANSVAIEALVWLIKTCEDPKTIDIALQAIAGAESNEKNRQLLKDCGADTMVSRRLIALSSESSNQEQLMDLYIRAQSFFQPFTAEYDGVDPSTEEGAISSPNREAQNNLGRTPQNTLHGELQKKVRDLRDAINDQITSYVTSSDRVFSPIPEKVQALRIGSIAGSHCLQVLQNGIKTQAREVLESSVDLLEKYRNGQARIGSKEIKCLSVGSAMLLSALLVDCQPDIGARYVVRLLRTTERGQNPLHLKYLGLPLIAYALSRYDYPGWTQRPPLNPVSRAERAIDVIKYYTLHPLELEKDVSLTMVEIALQELLSDPEGYKLDDEEIVAISEALHPGTYREVDIHTFPEKSHADSRSRTLRTLNGIAAIASGYPNGLFGREKVAIAYLTVLNRTRIDGSAQGAPVMQLYALVIECMLNITPSGPEAYGQNAALDLMQKFYGYFVSWTQDQILNLARSLDERGVIMQLKQVAGLEVNDINFVMKLFAIGQKWVLINHAIELRAVHHQDWRHLRPFVDDGTLRDSADSMTRGLEDQRRTLEEQYRRMRDDDQRYHHEYFDTIFGSFPQADGVGGQHGVS